MDRREQLNDAEESARLAIEGHQARLWTALPGIVTAVDLVKQTVSVQPAIQGEWTASDGTTKAVSLPLLVDVPVVWPRAGGFALTFPIAMNDEVLVIFSARCLDAWWQQGGVQPQAEPRMHDLSDGFAILAPTSQPKKLSAVQTDGMELRTEDRATYIRLTPGTIFIRGNIVHEGDVAQTGNTLRTGSLQNTGLVTAQSGLTVNQDVAAGAVTLVGNIVHTGTLTSNTKNIGSTHTHSGVQAGLGNTGVPN